MDIIYYFKEWKEQTNEHKQHTKIKKYEEKKEQIKWSSTIKSSIVCTIKVQQMPMIYRIFQTTTKKNKWKNETSKQNNIKLSTMTHSLLNPSNKIQKPTNWRKCDFEELTNETHPFH